ncbi:MAG: tRNA 2-thiouridine(34) synthase MnmA, partial [Verrucomicrobia bacterium]
FCPATIVALRGKDRSERDLFQRLFTTEVEIRDLRWNTPTPPRPEHGPLRLEGRVRYRDPRVAVRFEMLGSDRAHVVFTTPQRGLASGQVFAVHDGPRLLGGGIYA